MERKKRTSTSSKNLAERGIRGVRRLPANSAIESGRGQVHSETEKF